MYLILTDPQSMTEEAQRENFAKILKEAEEYQKRKEEWQRLPVLTVAIKSNFRFGYNIRRFPCTYPTTVPIVTFVTHIVTVGKSVS